MHDLRDDHLNECSYARSACDVMESARQIRIRMNGSVTLSLMASGDDLQAIYALDAMVTLACMEEDESVNACGRWSWMNDARLEARGTRYYQHRTRAPLTQIKREEVVSTSIAIIDSVISQLGVPCIVSQLELRTGRNSEGIVHNTRNMTMCNQHYTEESRQLEYMHVNDDWFEWSSMRRFL